MADCIFVSDLEGHSEILWEKKLFLVQHAMESQRDSDTLQIFKGQERTIPTPPTKPEPHIL